MPKPSAKPEPPMGVAVIAVGQPQLARIFDAFGVLRAVCDPTAASPEVARAVDPAQALRDPRVAGVAVAGPAQFLREIVRQALDAGKHVLVASPMALSEAEAGELFETAGQKGLLLMAGHPALFHPAFARLREMVAAGELGRIEYIYSNSLDRGHVSGEADTAQSVALRDISMILALAGDAPQTVLTSGDDQANVAQLEFASGLKAHVFVSRLHPFMEQKLVVVGEARTAIFDDALPWADKLCVYSRAMAEPRRADVPQGEALRLACRHFLDCMASGRRPPADGHENLQALRVLDASRKSLGNWAARTPVARAAPKYFAHPTALVDAGAEIGEGTKIWHFSHVLKGSRVGAKCNLGQNVVVGPDVSVGRGCKIQNNVSVYQGVTLEDDVFCGPSMVFTNIFNPRAHIPRMHEVRQTLVKKGAALGANCTIVCGNTVGRYAFVGAGAVVTKDVPDHAVMVGNPARQIGWMCACGEKLDPESLACPVCGEAYAAGENGLRRA